MYYISLPLPLVTVARWHKYKVVHVRKLAKINENQLQVAVENQQRVVIENEVENRSH